MLIRIDFAAQRSLSGALYRPDLLRAICEVPARGERAAEHEGHGRIRCSLTLDIRHHRRDRH